MDEILLKKTIANNLLYYRKKANLTQLELAEILNYSDKAISKWERAESTPDIVILCKIAKLYKININYLINDYPKKKSVSYNRNKELVSFLSAVIVWLVAVVAFVILELFVSSFNQTWLSFIYAIPLSLIVLLVFNKLWRRHFICFIIISLLIWSVILSIFLSFMPLNIWLIFIIGIPLQILNTLWFFIKKPIKCI